ncbi:basic proline-rich protein-like [Gymnogyps californianus]|uniref:basic proline-rich protein-like n=1 Tax=Gymnogyps californianus TaxID=33616 RepID=UPI0021C8EB66|nr:basic proline-rich protein-like [Gymnogyps californianus]
MKRDALKRAGQEPLASLIATRAGDLSAGVPRLPQAGAAKGRRSRHRGLPAAGECQEGFPLRARRQRGAPTGQGGGKAAATRAGQGLRWDPPVREGRRGGTVRGREPAPLAAPAPRPPPRQPCPLGGLPPSPRRGPSRSSSQPAGGTGRPLRRSLLPQGRARSGVSAGEAPELGGHGAEEMAAAATARPVSRGRVPSPPALPAPPKGFAPWGAGHPRHPPGTGRDRAAAPGQEPKAPWQTAPSHLGAGGPPHENVGAKEQGGEEKTPPPPERVPGPQGAVRAQQPAPPPLLGRGEAVDGKIPTEHRRAGGRSSPRRSSDRPGTGPRGGQERSRTPSSVPPGAPRRGRPGGSAQPGQRCEAAPVERLRTAAPAARSPRGSPSVQILRGRLGCGASAELAPHAGPALPAPPWREVPVRPRRKK